MLGMSAADWVTSLRLALVAAMWPLALSSERRSGRFGVILCGLTDYFDGRLTRQLGVASRHGGRLDTIADLALLLSVAIWLALLHPSLLRDGAGFLALVSALYAGSMVSSLAVFGRLVDAGQVSAKAAGALLYGLALFTLLTGIYESSLLTVAATALAISSVESLIKALAATRTIQLSGVASVIRSTV
ncbi:MAG: CDP-alcohol phosphatidyltransferase family protein, partial [Candidatus Dormibacteraceae bacterium]